MTLNSQKQTKFLKIYNQNQQTKPRFIKFRGFFYYIKSLLQTIYNKLSIVL